MSPVLAGGFFSPVPQGSPEDHLLNSPLLDMTKSSSVIIMNEVTRNADSENILLNF